MSTTSKVDAFMAALDHPLKAELEAVRKIIIKASPALSEDIKWGGPSFYYKEDMATFNPRIKNYVAVIFHKGSLIPQATEFFEEATKGKVYAKFYNMAEVKAKKKELEHMVKSWINLMDQQ